MIEYSDNSRGTVDLWWITSEPAWPSVAAMAEDIRRSGTSSVGRDWIDKVSGWYLSYTSKRTVFGRGDVGAWVGWDWKGGRQGRQNSEAEAWNIIVRKHLNVTSVTLAVFTDLANPVMRPGSMLSDQIMLDQMIKRMIQLLRRKDVWRMERRVVKL